MTPSDAVPARAKSLTQRVVDEISTRIRQELLRPGDRVPPEPELIREFGVSRTVVREALQRLQASGLIETQHGVGSFVRAPLPAPPLLSVDDAHMQLRDLLAMLELRICLEVEAAAMAAMRRTDVHLERMRAALAAFQAHLEAGASTAEDDFRFHLQIAMATGNSYFEQVLSNLGNATIARRRVEVPVAEPDDGSRFATAFPPLGRRKELALREHLAIFEAIRAADPAAARAAMFMHLNNSRERLRRLSPPA